MANELIVGAGLGDPPVLEHDNAIGAADGAQPMGDDDARGIHRRQAFPDDRLGTVVEGAGCLVEEDQARPTDQRAGDHHALPLST